MKIFELLILVFSEENDTFAVIWMKINVSSVFTLGRVYPLHREYLFYVWHLHTHTLLHLLCAQTTLGIGFLLFKVQLFLWKPEWNIQFHLSKTVEVSFFDKHVPLTQHYPAVQKISCCLVIAFSNAPLCITLLYNLTRNACETDRHSHSYNQGNCILLENKTGTTKWSDSSHKNW